MRAALVASLIGAFALATSAQTSDSGSLAGQVYDAATGKPIAGATVTLERVSPEPGEPAGTATTGSDGNFAFAELAAGSYRVRFAGPGYVESTADAVVRAGETSRADVALQALAAPQPDVPLAGPTQGELLDYEEFVVEGTAIEMEPLQLRLDSDELLNVLGAEDFAKFAAGDVAEGLKRVAGVNVVDARFAIIRGLEDRYSSTLFNGAPIPSPDPDRQSVQLDLFPSDVVDSLNVSKSFLPDQPSNSSGGSMDIVTNLYPEEPFLIKVAAEGGYNDNAWDRFLDFESFSPVGDETDGFDTADGEIGGFAGGTTELLGRALRYTAVANWVTGTGTEEGWQEARQPAVFGASSHFPAGDLAFGELSLTSGLFGLTTSEYEEQLTLFGGFGFDLDPDGAHQLDAAVFFTRKDTETVEYRQNGFLPGQDYASVLQEIRDGNQIDFNDFDGSSPPFVAGQVASAKAWIARGVAADLSEPETRGFPWYSAFFDSRSFDNRRELFVYQLNGDHDVGSLLDGLHFDWAANYATTTQDEHNLGSRFSYEPCRNDTTFVLECPQGVTPINESADLAAVPTTYPVQVEDLGDGKYMARRGIFMLVNDIDEDQYFAHFDGDYETGIFSWLSAEVRSGLWYETASRDVDSGILTGDSSSPTCAIAEGCIGGGTTQYVIWADTPDQLGHRIFATALPRAADGSFTNLLPATNESEREIEALHVGGKTTFFDDLDLLGGVRIERIFIESKNDPFLGGLSPDGSPLVFPTKYLFFDRYDNIVREGFLRNPPFNDEILGIQLPMGACRDQAGNVIPPGQRGAGTCVDLIDASEILSVANGEIDERRVLPAAGITYRPFEWLTLRGAWSRTVARPSFREMGFYVSVEPGTDDYSIGNPQLELSDVESFDVRVEVVWGDTGDLFAVSLFDKTIQDPIEQILIRDAGVSEATSTDTFRTFFNNPSDADLQGIEVEARKNLAFLNPDFADLDLPFLDFLEYVSIGGNFTWIDAEVGRSQAELTRSRDFFRGPADPGPTPFPALESKRRLYGQPEWIANADISFDHPDWGTRATLSAFAISDLLDAAGTAQQTQAGAVRLFTLDRYVDSFYQIDLVLSQELWSGLAVKLSAKNLTDTRRGIIYDTEQTGSTISERRYKVGRDYSFQLSWEFSGPDL